MTQKNRNIQLQADPYIVKPHDIHIDADYADWTADIKSHYLFFAENIEKLKQLVSVIVAETMHHVGVELSLGKLHQFGGELLRLKLQLFVGEKLNQIVVKELSVWRKKSPSRYSFRFSIFI